MPNRETMHNERSIALAGLSAAATGTITSASVDLSGYDSATFNLHFGATAPEPTSITVEESDDNSAWAAAAAAAVINDGGAHAVSTTRRIAYIGAKRYARVVTVLSASTILTVTASLGYPAQRPVTNPI